jgi:hypothetical protein
MERRTSSITRRRFLSASATAAAGAAVLATPGARTLAATDPLQSLVGAIDPSKLTSAQQLSDWQNYMMDVGVRFTGSPAHVAYLDFLESECQAAGLTTFHDPTQVFPRWEADYTQCSITLLGSSSGLPVDVMSYFPGSGNTTYMPDGALTARVVDVGQGLPQDFAAAIATGSLKGKIALVTEPPFPMYDLVAYPYYYNYDPNHTMLPNTPFNKWSLNILSPQSLATPSLAEQAGCAGMIITMQSSTKNALGQYISFLATIRGDQANREPGLPTLYIDHATGAKLKKRIKAGNVKARMVLRSTTLPDTGTDEIVAVLPGANGDLNNLTKGENVIVASHTDGTSASEENGPLGMLAIARYFAQIPRSQRRRTLIFCFATGHFTGYTEDTQWFIDHHPEVLAKTAATLTIEHLGQKSFTDDWRNNAYIDDHLPEVGISYVTADPAIIATARANHKKEKLLRAPVVNGPVFGVGRPFSDANLPGYSYITGPNSLYQMDRATSMEGTDANRMYDEIKTFTRILASWETLDKRTLGAGKGTLT